MRRESEPPMPDPLAYFLTWATYGVWLPGDERGWVQHGKGFQLPDPIRKMEVEARMSEDACILDEEQRAVVNQTIVEHCCIRGWTLRAVNCRSNHLHVVVAADREPDEVRRQFKAWCTRRLKELEARRRGVEEKDPRWRFGLVSSVSLREQWWAERGSKRYINDEESLQDAIQYVLDGQDRPH